MRKWDTRNSIVTVGVVGFAVAYMAFQEGTTTLLWVAAVVALYWAPTMLAYQRGAPNRQSIVVVNVLLGWTLIGWVVALAMAVRDPQVQSEVSARRE